MNRFALFVALCLLPVLAGAQAVRCKDPASGRILYTDQPCPGGELVVPRRSEAELAQDAASAAQAREAAERREALTVQREQLRLEGARQAEAARVPPSPAESDGCRAARAEASFRAASRTASEEEIRTARYNAALACGQPAPAEIVVVPPPPAPHWRPPPRPRREPWEPPRPPPSPRYAPGTEPLPMR